jgi:hypothetical protein
LIAAIPAGHGWCRVCVETSGIEVPLCYRDRDAILANDEERASAKAAAAVARRERDKARFSAFLAGRAKEAA